jgi:hypothetical protein
MDFKADIFLRHNIWLKAFDLKDELKIFSRVVDVFIVAASIGIADDEIVENEDIENPKSIGRNTLNTNDGVNHLLTFLFQNVILSTKHLSLSSDERKKIAFNHDDVDSKYSPSNFLVKYATYGMIKIAECMTDHDIETIFNIIELIKKYKDRIFIDEKELLEIELD